MLPTDTPHRPMVKPPTAPPPLDFALLQQAMPHPPLRSRRTLWLLLGLVLLVVASVVALVLYLQRFEDTEEERRRVADGQWLEHSTRFHFTRLEEDLLAQARRAAAAPLAPPTGQPATAWQGGLLWTEPGAVLWHGWHAAERGPLPPQLPPEWQTHTRAHPDNTDQLASMADIAVGLRRPAYGGPMQRADGSLSDVVWLAVPLFERGRYLGAYVAALSMDACVQGLVPTWLRQQHAVRLAPDGGASATDGPAPYLAPMNLPGTDLFIEMTALSTHPAPVPRLFLLVAILFLLGMLGALWALRRDMGKRQRVQALLQTQVALRAAVENSTHVGLLARAGNGRMLYANEAFCRMAGCDAQALQGRTSPLPHWPPELTPGAPEAQAGEVEAVFQPPNGPRIDVLIHQAPLTSASGQPLGWISSVLDISERKRGQRLAAQQQQKLEASGRLVAMGEVASTLAHELNQPLGALSSFANGLLNRLHSHTIALPEVTPVVARMARLAERAGNIIQRVNAFARRRELSRQVLDVSAFVQEATAPHRRTPGVRLLDPTPPGPLWVLADRLLLEHVVANLVGNALDWAGHGTATLPRVQMGVELDEARQEVVIHVADNGPGVPDDQREHIFNAFFSTKDGGMGMGLAICRSIVEAHHGRIGLSRDPELGGARFAVCLPLHTPPVAP